MNDLDEIPEEDDGIDSANECCCGHDEDEHYNARAGCLVDGCECIHYEAAS